MKWFGRRAGRDDARPMRGVPREGARLGEWPAAYAEQVREGYCLNPVAQRAVRLVAETVAQAPLDASDPAMIALVMERTNGQPLIETLAAHLLLHDEAIALIDMLVMPAVQAIVDTPPAAPEPGQCWIVGPSGTGAFAGHAGAIAGWTPNGWRFVAPREGARSFVIAADCEARWRGAEWHLGIAEVREVRIGGVRVVGARQGAIARPTGGNVPDPAVRIAIDTIITVLEAHGLIATA
jgi:hypothetical protein